MDRWPLNSRLCACPELNSAQTLQQTKQKIGRDYKLTLCVEKINVNDPAILARVWWIMETPKITRHAIKKKRKRKNVGIFTILKLDAIRKTKKKKKEKRPISVQRLSGLGGGGGGGGWWGGGGGGPAVLMYWYYQPHSTPLSRRWQGRAGREKS